MTRIIVTGGAGFIGSHLVERLIARGDEVVCLDDFNDFYDPALKRRNLAAVSQRVGFRLVEADLNDQVAIDDAFSPPPELVVHLAARAGVRPSVDEPELYCRVNCEGTARLLQSCQRLGVQRFVFASSSSVYGGNEKVPFSEEDPVEHLASPYAATKRAGELMCHTFHHLHGLHTTCLRFFTVYGPRQRPEMAIHKFTRRITQGRTITLFGDGRSSRDYTYVDDIVDGVLGAIDRPKGFVIYNLGGSRPIKLRRLVRLIAEQVGREPLIEYASEQPGDVPRTWADVERSGRELGYAPRVPVEEGIRRFVDWYRANRRPPARSRP